jgi:hypothetical protein
VKNIAELVSPGAGTAQQLAGKARVVIQSASFGVRDLPFTKGQGKAILTPSKPNGVRNVIFSRTAPCGSSFPLVDIHVKNGVPVTNRHVVSVIEHDAEHIVLNVPILSVLAHLGWNFISDKTNCYLHGIVLSILATDTA